MKQGRWREDGLGGKGERLYIHPVVEDEKGRVHL
jgi:hypothetical protein